MKINITVLAAHSTSYLQTNISRSVREIMS